ncbi:MAG: OmpA family protein [Bacteroidales bacterium]|nr:OmpA family protein [Bacteroidales bacterium]MCK9498320.1 OmpA family protein [Bacteroidales bacterium]MDY0314571.1 OmpA family protein [Bacteroidales bacterium]NLB87412.1 OmpA family protein [Bacteroidales bacterium]
MRIKKQILSFFLLLFISSSFSQSVQEFCNEIDDKKLIKNFNKSIEYINSGKLDKAEIILAKILDEEPEFTEAWLGIAEINYIKYKNAKDIKSQNKFYANYTKSLEKIVATCPHYNNWTVNYTLGKIFYEKEDYKNAKKYLDAYIKNTSIENKNIKDAELIIEYIDSYLDLISNPVPFKPTIVEGISTVNDDFLPLISPDGSLAFFTHAFMKKDISSITSEKYTEEFSVARALDESGLRFSKGQPLPYPFNTGKNQGASTLTIDNSTLYITICEFVSRTYDNCDIYYSVRKANGWSELINLGPNINGLNTWESQPSISADGKTLYFASIREDNIGFDPNNPTSDIWYSTKNENGTWSKAKNLGPNINTPGNEKSPFIHSDSQTLYFSSDGHKGLGGYDIFFSKYRNQEWGIPVNLGYPINTKANDLGFVVNTQGTKAYFASNKFEGKGGWDIYSFDLYPEARPEKVFLVKGKLIDDIGEIITEAKLEVRNTRTKETSEGLVDSETGNYAVAVNSDKEKHDDFVMLVKKEDYSFTSALIEVDEETFITPINIDFEMKPIEKGKSVEIRDINYASASYQIDKKSLLVLDEFIIFLKDNPKLKIEIRGHTDSIGSLQTNLTLSNNRAKEVYNYLLANEIEANRLQYKGYGPNLPIATNETETGRAKNRRTEFYIIDNQ